VSFPVRDSAVRIAVLFALVGGLWVVVSDAILARMSTDPDTIAQLDILKGWAFVAVLAILLYLERRRSNRDLKRLAAIVESSDDAIIGADVNGCITDWNQGAVALYGYVASEVRGRSVSILYPRDRREELQRFLDIYRTGKPVRHFETIRMHKDGHPVQVSLTASPIRDSAGRLLGTATIMRGIADRKRTEEAARLAEVGRLASGLAHEIRNPLNAMRMQLAVLRDVVGTSGEEAASEIIPEIDCVEHEVLRVQNLASDFLAYGRPAFEHPEAIRLTEFLDELVHFLQPQFEHTGGEVVSECTGENITVVADRGKLQQVLLNLAENARQALKDTGGRLVLACGAASPRDARIRVQDNGCGIPPDRLQRIFEAFYSTREEGTGLGLAIVKQIVETAGGRIRVESEIGQGTSFEIQLPRAGIAPGSGKEEIRTETDER